MKIPRDVAGRRLADVCRAIRFSILCSLVLAPLLAAQGGPAALKLQAARKIKQRGDSAKAQASYEALLPEIRAAADRMLLAQVLLEAGQSKRSRRILQDRLSSIAATTPARSNTEM